jgi:hypothetical protein
MPNATNQHSTYVDLSCQVHEYSKGGCQVKNKTERTNRFLSEENGEEDPAEDLEEFNEMAASLGLSLGPVSDLGPG